VNQSAPSGPAVMSTELLAGVGIGYSVIAAGATAGTNNVAAKVANDTSRRRPSKRFMRTLSEGGRTPS
jgi:hypothetical protein